MEKTQAASPDLEDGGREDEPTEAVELVLFHVGECYVYLIPPRKSAASYRADEWDVNKWAWEGALKVISKGEECIIRLEDKSTGELYARAFLREGEPHPLEPVIDSSRYFVLRVEENIGGRIRHAFIGIGFRERTEAYDFQAALHDHLKYLNKKKTAEEMEQHFQHTSSVDYSLKDGQTLVLKIKTKESPGMRSSTVDQGKGSPGMRSSTVDQGKGSPGTRSSTVDQGVSNLSLDEKSPRSSPKGALLSLKPPPPPPSSLSPVASPKKSTVVSQEQAANLQEPAGTGAQEDNGKAQEVVEDDFGDFQTAG